MFLKRLSSGKLPKCFIDCIAKTPVSNEMQSSWLDCSKTLKGHGNLTRRGQAGGYDTTNGKSLDESLCDGVGLI